MQKSIKITILSLSILLLLNSNAYADTDNSTNINNSTNADNSTKNNFISSFIEKYEKIKAIKDSVTTYAAQNYEKTAAPLLGAVAGYIDCGFWCAIPGFIFGSIDEAMVLFGVSEKHYITYGMFGMAMGNKIGQNLSPDAIEPAWYAGTGMLVGLLTSQQKTIDLLAKNADNLAKAATECHAGLIAKSALKEMFKKETKERHYVVPALTLTHLVGSVIYRWTNLTSNSITKILFTDQTEAAFKKLANTMSLLNTANNQIYPGLIAQDKIDSRLKKQLSIAIGSELITHFLSLTLVNNENNVTKIFDDVNLKKVIKSGVKFAVFIVPKLLTKATTETVYAELDRNFNYEIKNNIQLKLNSGQNMLRVSHDKEAAEAIPETDYRIDGLNAFTSYAINDITKSIVEIYGTSAIIIYSPDLFLYSLFFKQACSLLANSANDNTQKSEENKHLLKNKLLEHNLYITNNALGIVALGNQEIEKEENIAINNELIKAEEELRKTQEAGKISGLMQAIFSSIPGQFKSEIIQYFITKAFHEKPMTPNEKNLATTYLTKNIQSLESIDNTNKWRKENLDKILIIQGAVFSNKTSVDTIVRDQAKQEDKLILDNLELATKEKKLYKIDHVELDMGKIYAITGINGAGKTRLLLKIKGLKEDGIIGSGNILYPKGTNQNEVIIVQIDNDPLNEPPKKSFPIMKIFEYLKNCYQGTRGPLNAQDKQQINDLLKEGGFADAIDSKRTWGDLSKGEKNRILILSAILNQPSILLLDESLSGFDDDTLPIFKNLLKKYLSKSLVVIIDHQVKKSAPINADHFYEKDFYFNNEQATLKDF